MRGQGLDQSPADLIVEQLEYIDQYMRRAKEDMASCRVIIARLKEALANHEASLKSTEDWYNKLAAKQDSYADALATLDPENPYLNEPEPGDYGSEEVADVRYIPESMLHNPDEAEGVAMYEEEPPDA